MSTTWPSGEAAAPRAVAASSSRPNAVPARNWSAGRSKWVPTAMTVGRSTVKSATRVPALSITSKSRSTNSDSRVCAVVTTE
ncbi:hypothetical protein BCD49_06165 [Pseudofrankia sp. EUN1h]|nr:hypothetical protein BCD49_06165 [Pseudofrankia sp. EUN1h]